MSFVRNPEIDLFIVLAYDVLRAEKSKGGGRYDTVHTVWNGFNTAFRKIFPGVDPVLYTKGLAEEGLIQLAIAPGGASLKPCTRFIMEAQADQEELGIQLLRFLEDFSNVSKPTPKAWEPGDTAKRLQELGYKL